MGTIRIAKAKLWQPTSFALAVRLLALTGMRLGEVLNLEWLARLAGGDFGFGQPRTAANR